MASVEHMRAIVENAGGRAPILLTCEHATNYIPPDLEGLGLSQAQLQDHVAWDIGALGLAQKLSALLDAPLVAAPASRLLVDPNRAFDAPDLIPATAEGAPVPGNLNLTPDDREARVAAYHTPFHDAIGAILRAQTHLQALIAVHSFTPQLFGRKRPWHAGMLHDADTRISDVMIEVLKSDPSLMIGRNEPYAPEQGVFYTMDRHAAGRATAMIEVRNDLIADDAGQANWAARLEVAIRAALEALRKDGFGVGAWA